MKIVFLCGGVGKRMFPLTEDKFLLEFVGRTLLEHQIKIALDTGIKEFVIIGNPGNISQIKSITSTVKNVTFKFAVQKKPLGIADALGCASELLDGEVLVVNPNDVFHPTAYQNLLDDYKKGKSASYILGYEVKQYFPGGYLAVKSNGQLTRIIEKPEPGTEPSNLVNILLHLHTNMSRLFAYMASIAATRDDVYECTMDQMIKDGYRIKVTPYNNFWAPIKYPWHIFNVVRYFLDTSRGRIARSAGISERAIVSGKVIMGKNVRVLENAVIRGPVYIGPNTVIGNGALVRDYSHIGANCVVGFATEIKGSYVGDNCWFHSSYIGDSIIGKNCSFGAGTVTANFRFDEKDIPVRYGKNTLFTGRDKMGAIIGDNCKTGVNSSILPGRRLGPNSIVGANVCLANNLEPDTNVLVWTDYRISRNNIRLNLEKKQELRKRLSH